MQVECRAYIALMQGRAPPPHSKAGRALAAQNGAPCIHQLILTDYLLIYEFADHSYPHLAGSDTIYLQYILTMFMEGILVMADIDHAQCQ